MTSTLTMRHTCPYCGGLLSAMTGVDHSEPPRGGDISVCFHCAGILLVNEDTSTRTVTLRETQDLLTHYPALAQAVAAVMAKRNTP